MKTSSAAALFAITLGCSGESKSPATDQTMTGGSSNGSSTSGTGGSTSGTGGTQSGTGGSGSSTASGGGSGGTTPRPSSGCGNAAPFSGTKEFKVTLPAGGGTPTERAYDVVAPDAATYDPNKPLAVVFWFHGAGGSKGIYNGFPDTAGGEFGKNAIFVSPQGVLVPPYESYGNGWNEACDGFDMPFVDEMLAQVSSDFCVDEARVFATGYSWGGDMANAIGCCRGDTFRGVVPTCGGEMLLDQSTCTEKKSAYRLSTGDQDTSYPQKGIDDIVAFYRTAHGCEDIFTTVTPSDSKGSCKLFEGCDVPVIQCLHTGLGHSEPPGWNDDVWNFVKSFN